MDDITHLELSALVFEGLDKGGSEAIGGSLREVKVCQRMCSAKRLCDVIQEVRGDSASLSDEDVAVVAQRFRSECVSLSKLRHPNILQFVGVHRGGPLDVAMVMEHVYTDLDQCLRAHPNLDPSVKLSVLFDVSCGLLYLHTRDPPVVHRNLTASNVVLSGDLTAKIADLRVSKVFDLETQVSRLPEGLVYMPPEALSRPPTCDVKLDVFSFGVLCLFVVNEGFAASGEQSSSENPCTPPHTSAHAAVKRQCALERIGTHHPLCSIITQCSREQASMRPAMVEVNERLQKLCLQNPRKFKDVLKTVVDFETRKDLKSLRAHLEEKKEEIAKLAQRLLIVDIDVCKLEGAKEAVAKNKDKKKVQTLTMAKVHSRISYEDTMQKGHFSVVQLMQDKLRLAEEEKKQLQLEIQKNSDSLRYEVDMCRQNLILKTQECDVLQTRVHQFEKAGGQVGTVHKGTMTSQEVAKTGSGRLGKTLSHDSTQELCDSCGGLKKQVWELELRLEKYQDECGAYQEQSAEQKRQIQFHADAHYQLIEENDKLKRSLDQELMRVTELLTEVKGREKEGTDACTSYQQEKAKRLVLEKRCADLELVNDSLRQENLILFNQNDETKLKISESNLGKTRCADETPDGLGTHVCKQCAPSPLRAPPTHFNTPNHWEAPEVLAPPEPVGVALTSEHMATSCSHGDVNCQ